MTIRRIGYSLQGWPVALPGVRLGQDVGNCPWVHLTSAKESPGEDDSAFAMVNGLALADVGRPGISGRAGN